MKYQQQVNEALAYLSDRLELRPKVVIILGTGLGKLGELVTSSQVVPYGDIPYFPQSTVPSHHGKLICGLLGGKQVAILQGRFHYYEGYSARETTFPLRVLSLFGCRYLFCANAAGGLNPSYAPGTLMLIKDHINLIPDNPLWGENIEAWGPRFPDLSKAYAQDLLALAQEQAHKAKINNVVKGIYIATPGPSLETPAETRYLRNCGADAVGMSTIPEIIVGVHAGLKILAISMVSNVNDPDNFQPILIEDILAEARLAEDKFVKLMINILENIQ